MTCLCKQVGMWYTKESEKVARGNNKKRGGYTWKYSYGVKY